MHTPRLLNGTLALHDVRDVEAFCAAIIQRRQPDLPWVEQDDLLAELIEDCWVLSTRFQPGGLSFSTWAQTTLVKRAGAWERRKYRTTWKFKDRTHVRPRPQFVSLDTPEGRALSDRTVDGPESGGSDLAWLLGAGGGTDARPNGTGGTGHDRLAA